MSFDNPWVLLSGLLIGLVGFMMFNHGRKEANLRVLSTGIFLCVYPYFVTSILLLWGIFASALGVLYFVSQNA